MPLYGRILTTVEVNMPLRFFHENVRGIIRFANLHKTNHTCHQKPNPSRETIPLKILDILLGRIQQGQAGLPHGNRRGATQHLWLNRQLVSINNLTTCCQKSHETIYVMKAGVLLWLWHTCKDTSGFNIKSSFKVLSFIL
jgi:hypothetical protein